MIYGKSKALNMSRSLLPSTRSKGARDDKAAVKRATRHNIRTELHKVAVDPDYYDESHTDFAAYPEHEIREVVYERRVADKTGPFERWAAAITEDVNQDSRLTYVKSLVPEGVIGDHAISHLEWKTHFASKAELRLKENIQLNREEGRIRNRYSKKKPVKRLSYDEEIAVLRKIIEDSWLHRELNKFMGFKVTHRRPTETVKREVLNKETGEMETRWVSVYLPFPPGVEFHTPRKLLGTHDIETFYDDVRHGWREPEIIVINGKRYSNPKAFHRGYDALYAFLDAVHNKKKLPKAFATFNSIY